VTWVNHEFMTQRHPGGGALGAPATGTAGRIAGETSALRASSRAVNTERSAPDIADVKPTHASASLTFDHLVIRFFGFSVL
jgi:hypothetical protein